MTPTSPMDVIIEQNYQLTPAKQKVLDTKKKAPEPPRKGLFSDTNNEAVHVSAAYGVVVNDLETARENIILHKELSESMKKK